MNNTSATPLSLRQHEPRKKYRVWKSIGAVLAGFFTIAILDNGTDFMMRSLGIFPNLNQPFTETFAIVLAIAYRSVFAVAGSFITATLAPSKPVQHAMILGAVGVALNAMGILMIYGPWGSGEFAAVASQTTILYPLSLLLLALPCARLGGALNVERS